ncbi:MAG: histidine kinase [Opitutus sp.]|nr:histidine kinase [Opitutus sp.]
MPAAEIEITAIPPLSPDQVSLLDMHSVLNVLNVLHGELYLLGVALGDEEVLRPALARGEGIRRDLADPAAALRHAATLGEHEAAVLANVEAALRAHADKAGAPEVAESVGNIRSVFQVLGVRAREILARARAPGEWVDVPIEELRTDFRQIFAAIEKNSHGRYRIIYNLARQEHADYYIDFVIESDNQRTVSLPLLFKDVMRDLMANARKYTAPGGTINAGLYETAEKLKFTVQDSGCGIPTGELQTVMHYGKRGSNVASFRTMGGGFGLTKAFFVTKQFGGRFWIRSEVGAGTRIRIEIPRRFQAMD